jgi:hypothetical protein
MEGLTTPQSNKRTAGLPNSCPVCLQSLYSILPGSLAVPGHSPLCQTHTRRDTCPLAMPASNPRPTPHRNTHPLAAGSMTTGIPATSLHWTKAWSRSLSSLGTTTLQALLSHSHMWDDWTPTPPIRPCLAQAPCAPLGQAPFWCKTAASTSLPGALPPGRSQPQLYRLAR